MAHEIISILEQEFSFPAKEVAILKKTLGQLNREERKLYYQNLKSKVSEFKSYLTKYYQDLDQESQEALLNAIVESLLLNRGEPDLSDRIALEALDRLEIYKRVREAAQQRDVSLKIGSTSGGCVAVIVFVTIILLILSFILYK